MKKETLFAACIVSILMVGCCKEIDKDCKMIPAQVLRYDCDRVILKLLTTDEIGDRYWLDAQTGIPHTNVVSYYNTCEIAALTKGEKKILFVNLEKIGNNPVAANCYQCQAVSTNPPLTKVKFTKINTVDCQGSNPY